MTTSSKLHGIGVLVTRPAHQAGHLSEIVAAAGGTPVRFPLLRIRDCSETPAVQQALQRLAGYHILLFVSPNAVEIGLEAIKRHSLNLPDNTKLACVGRGTARAIERRLGRPPELVPTERFDSEGLLALPGLQQVTGKRILILRGNGGRELLSSTLRERGASVDYAEVYSREAPKPEDAEPGWLDRCSIITITSSEALQHLVALCPAEQRADLLAKPLVVVSPRTADLARELGFRQPARLATQASDEAILAAVCRWADTSPKMERQ